MMHKHYGCVIPFHIFFNVIHTQHPVNWRSSYYFGLCFLDVISPGNTNSMPRQSSIPETSFGLKDKCNNEIFSLITTKYLAGIQWIFLLIIIHMLNNILRVNKMHNTLRIFWNLAGIQIPLHLHHTIPL